MKYSTKITVLALCCCVSFLMPAAGAETSRTANPALLYWQAAAELPPLGDEKAKQLREVAEGKVVFKKEILEELDFTKTLHFLRKAVASEAPCDWGLAWEEGVEMRIPHLSKMREFSVMTLVLAEEKFANDETAAGIDFLLMAHHIARDTGASPTIIGNVIQNLMEQRTITTAARHCLGWDEAVRNDYARGLAALPKLTPVHEAFLAELVWIDWIRNMFEEDFEETRKKLELYVKESGQFKSPEVIEEMIEIFQKLHARGVVALKMEGEARSLAVAEFEKEIAAGKGRPKSLFVSLLMPSLQGVVRREDQTAIAREMLKAALKHGPEISEDDVKGKAFELKREDGLELNSKELEFSLILRK